MASTLLTRCYKKRNRKKDNKTTCLHDDLCESNKKNYLTVTNVQSIGTEGLFIGDHKTQESEGGEADLHTYFDSCKKNPGHRQFIPVDTLILEHLPEGYQDNDLYTYIKAIADLTVRVCVTKSSPHRPMFWPKTSQPYPFHTKDDIQKLRTGTGNVWNVKRFQDGVRQDGHFERSDYTKCWCRKCKDLVSPSNVWWEFDVTTATHVVFDDIEASHTTLRLFYDRDDSPVVSVDKVKVYYVNINFDVCILKCVTCHKKLGNKLIGNWKSFSNVRLKIWKKYYESISTHKLNFIVSHPHGCPKKISIGQWNDKQKVGNITQFTYTTCTCPGSSGAHVQCVGYYDVLSELVHSGSYESEFNYSGLGYE
ncbi:hypothetical protein BgiBS90_000262 [Biomphalaria glabrata]|nr:hypothetical protein BgiBS90_000262 [Biomphalaria glabrata]